MLKALAFGGLLGVAAWAQDRPYGIGNPATPDEVARLNLTVYPDGTGLPKGTGNADRGSAIYKEKCAACHNEQGEGREGQWPALVGGRGSLASKKPVKSVGSYWPYATTVFDFIRRAMPFDRPRSLSADEVYSVTAFVLYLNGIVDQKQELNERNLAAIAMPNKNGFVRQASPVIPTGKPVRP